MSEYRRITVPLGRDEWQRLTTAADQEYRHPRDQARFILRQALGLTEKLPNGEKHNGAGTALGSSTGAAVTTFQA